MASTSPAQDRVITLDLLRGIAVMGIFSVNIIGMAMIEPAYYYPGAYGTEGLADSLVWLANFILVDHKMRALFSILFGASMLLVIERARASGQSPARVHFARMAALLLFGLLHFYLIWWGDILTLYAVTGMIAFLFWRLPARSLLLLALLLLAWDYTPGFLGAHKSREAYEAAHAPGATDEARAAWDKRRAFFEPDAGTIAEDAATHRSVASLARNTLTERRWDPVGSFRLMWMETLGMMMLGMAGLRSGYLTGDWHSRSYWRAAAIGIGIGGGAFVTLAALSWRSGLRLPEIFTGYYIYSRPVGVLMALGYAALIILAFRKPSRARARVAAVGRAAFTNYLGASLIALFLFVGLGCYGQLSRLETWLIVPLTWIIMLAWSKPWLDRFAYGPFEWLWRSLARWELQPMRRQLSPSAVAA